MHYCHICGFSVFIVGLGLCHQIRTTLQGTKIKTIKMCTSSFVSAIVGLHSHVYHSILFGVAIFGKHLKTMKVVCLPIFAAAGHFNYLKSAYLYLQDMTTFETTNPAVVSQFRKGLHVIRRTDKYWAGLGCDLVIEQTLMRTLKSNGGLTRGSGMTDEQRIVWTMSLPVSSLYNLAMQDFTDTMYASSEQHKDIAQSRVRRDASDLEKLSTKLRPCSPFAPDPSRRNIFTGVVATKDVNVTRFQELDTRVVQELIGKAAFTCSFIRSLKAKTLAFSSAVKVSGEQSIDPALLFQRLLVVSQSGDISIYMQL